LSWAFCGPAAAIQGSFKHTESVPDLVRAVIPYESL
jgi:hypothetical protein